MITRDVAQTEAYEIRLDWEFAAAAVHQDGKTDNAGPAKISQRVQRRSRGAAREQDIIYEQQRRAVDRDVQAGGPHERAGSDL